MSERLSSENQAELLAEFLDKRSATARERLLDSMIPLADYFARRYADRPVEYEDLRQVARLGLVKSIDRFDPSFDVSLATFAGRTIDGELKHWFRDKAGTIRVPRSIQRNSGAVAAAQRRLEQQLGRAPTARDLAAATKLDLDQVIEALEARELAQPMRLEGSVDDDGLPLQASLGTVDAGFSQQEVQIMVNVLLSELTEQEAEVLRLRYFEELSQQEVADRVGVSQMQVSRVLRSSLAVLKSRLRNTV